MSSQDGERKRLESLIQTSTALITTILPTLQHPQPQTELSSSASDPQALNLLRDATTLIRSHTTKLSLLIITPPLTPSAISPLLADILSGPLPVLSTTPRSSYTFFQGELVRRSARVLATLRDLLLKIPLDAALSGDEKDGARGSIPATGLVWDSCDRLTALIGGGPSTLLAQKMREWKDTLKDMAQELKDWEEEEEDDREEEEEEEEEDMLDEILSGKPIPRDDPDNFRPRVKSVLRILRLVILFHQALGKHRATLPQETVPRVDQVVSSLQKLPDEFGDLACAFYDLDTDAVDDAMRRCVREACAAADLVCLDWSGSRDEFTKWVDKFQVEMKNI